MSETSVVLSSETIDGTDDLIISIPKREQTSDEVERTHKFAEECVELLKHVPECRLAFNKFIPGMILISRNFEEKKVIYFFSKFREIGIQGVLR